MCAYHVDEEGTVREESEEVGEERWPRMGVLATEEQHERLRVLILYR